jgi:hypothetical protein
MALPFFWTLLLLCAARKPHLRVTPVILSFKYANIANNDELNKLIVIGDLPWKSLTCA